VTEKGRYLTNTSYIAMSTNYVFLKTKKCILCSAVDKYRYRG